MLIGNTCPVMTDLPTLVGPVVTSHPGTLVPERFQFECHVAYDPTETDGAAKFNVTFLFDDVELEGPDMLTIGTITVNSSNPIAVLHDYHLINRLGKRVMIYGMFFQILSVLLTMKLMNVSR